MCQGKFMSKNANKAETYFDGLVENTPQSEERGVERGVDKLATSKQKKIGRTRSRTRGR